MSWKSVVILVFIYNGIVHSLHIDGYDDGFWPKFSAGSRLFGALGNGYWRAPFFTTLDLTYAKDASNGLQIILVRPGNKSYKHYAISRAVDILKDKDFNASRKTVMFAHGYNDLPRYNSHPLLKTYLEQPDYNVFVLNSMAMLSDISYSRAARATWHVGKRAGMVLSQMMKAGFNIDTFDLLGQSLGGHIVGFMGKTYFKITGKKIPRIIALDPAGPCFRQADPKDRLDKSDADFVQVIHTNGGGFGLVNAVGHVDFYVNGGRWQPTDIAGVSCYVICSHARPNLLRPAAMMAPEGSGFIGVECASVDLADKSNCYTHSAQRTAIMGPKADPKISGIFYVRTSNNYPFYLGKQGTKDNKKNLTMS